MNPWGHNPSAKRRDKLFIIAEIIEIARDGSLKTQVMYRANLSFTQLNDYLRFMLRISLLEKVLENEKDVFSHSCGSPYILSRFFFQDREFVKHGFHDLPTDLFVS